MILAIIISFSFPKVYADGSIALSESGGILTISGNGFTAEEGTDVYVWIDVNGHYFYNAHVSGTGSFSIKIPVTNGDYEIIISTGVVVNNPVGILTTAQISVTDVPPSIPDFPMPFSLPILFAIVAVSYFVIRKKTQIVGSRL